MTTKPKSRSAHESRRNAVLLERLRVEREHMLEYVRRIQALTAERDDANDRWRHALNVANQQFQELHTVPSRTAGHAFHVLHSEMIRMDTKRI